MEKRIEQMSAAEILEALQSEEAQVAVEEITKAIRFVGKMEDFINLALPMLSEQGSLIERNENRITELENAIAALKGQG